MKQLKPFKERDYNFDVIDTPRNTEVKNTQYFKPFVREVKKWKDKHHQAIIMLELKDLFNNIYKVGFSDGQLSSNSQKNQSALKLLETHYYKNHPNSKYSKKLRKQLAD